MSLYTVVREGEPTIIIRCSRVGFIEGDILIGEDEVIVSNDLKSAVKYQTVAYIPNVTGFYIDGDLANVRIGFIPKGDL